MWMKMGIMTGMRTGQIFVSPSSSPYPIEKVESFPYPYPYPYPINAGILCQNMDEFGQ